MFLVLSVASKMQSWGACSGFIFFCAVIAGAALALECQTWVLVRGAISPSCKISGYCAWVEEVPGCDTWRCWIPNVAGSCLSYQWWVRPRSFLPWSVLPHSVVLVVLSWRFSSIRINCIRFVNGFCDPLMSLFCVCFGASSGVRFVVDTLVFWSYLGIPAAICSPCYSLGWYLLVLSVAR